MTDKNQLNWKKVTLPSERKNVLLQTFADLFAERNEDMTQEYYELAGEVYRHFVDGMPPIVRLEIQKVEANRTHQRHTFLRCAGAMKLKVDVRKSRAKRFANRKFLTFDWYAYYSNAKRTRLHEHQYWGLPDTGVVLPYAHPLAKEVIAQYTLIEETKGDQRAAYREFEQLLKSCRNCGQLLEKFPQARELFPADWVVMASPKAKDLVPTQDVKKLAAVIAAEKAFKKMKKAS